MRGQVGVGGGRAAPVASCSQGQRSAQSPVHVAIAEAAEEFAQGDPFVLHGVVARWHVREWNEVLA